MGVYILIGLIIAMLPFILSGIIGATVMISNVVFGLAMGFAQANLYGLLAPGVDTGNFNAFFFSSNPTVQAFYLTLIALVLFLLFGVLVWESVKKVFSWSILNTNTNDDQTWNWKGMFKWVGIGLATLVLVPGLIFVLQQTTGLVSTFLINATQKLQTNLNFSTLIGAEALLHVRGLQFQLIGMQESFNSIFQITANGQTFEQWLETKSTSDFNWSEVFVSVRSNLKNTIDNLSLWTQDKWNLEPTKQAYNDFLIGTAGLNGFNSILSNLKLDNSNASAFWMTLLGFNTDSLIQDWDWNQILTDGDLTSIETFVGGAIVLPQSTFWGSELGGKNVSTLAGILGSMAASPVLYTIENSGATLPVGSLTVGFKTLEFVFGLSTSTNYSLLSSLTGGTIISSKATMPEDFTAYISITDAVSNTSPTRLFSSIQSKEGNIILTNSPWVVFVNAFLWPVLNENGTASFVSSATSYNYLSLLFQIMAIFVLFYGCKLFFKFALYGAMRLIQIIWSFVLAIAWAFYGWKDSEPYQQQIRNLFGYTVSILSVLFSLYLFTFVTNLLITGQMVGAGIMVEGVNALDYKNNLAHTANGLDVWAIGNFEPKTWITMIAGLIIMIVLQNLFIKIPDQVTEKLKIAKYSSDTEEMYQDVSATVKSIAKSGSMVMGGMAIANIGALKATGAVQTKIGQRMEKKASSIGDSTMKFNAIQRQTKGAELSSMAGKMYANSSTAQTFAKATGISKAGDFAKTVGSGVLFGKARDTLNKDKQMEKKLQKQHLADEVFFKDAKGNVVQNNGMPVVNTFGIEKKSKELVKEIDKTYTPKAEKNKLGLTEFIYDNFEEQANLAKKMGLPYISEEKRANRTLKQFEGKVGVTATKYIENGKTKVKVQAWSKDDVVKSYAQGVIEEIPSLNKFNETLLGDAFIQYATTKKMPELLADLPPKEQEDFKRLAAAKREEISAMRQHKFDGMANFNTIATGSADYNEVTQLYSKSVKSTNQMLTWYEKKRNETKKMTVKPREILEKHKINAKVITRGKTKNLSFN